MKRSRLTLCTQSPAFSLVELLVVISIIAIIASLLIVVLPTVRNKGTLTNCTANLRQFHSGILLYAADNNGELPVGHKSQSRANSSWNGVWWYSLWEYMGIAPNTEKNAENLYRFFDEYGCPMGNGNHINYAMSSYLTGDNYRLSALAYPSRNMLMVTHRGNSRARPQEVSNPSWDPPGEPDVGWNFWYNRSANVLFLDGSVRTVTYEDISAISGDLDDAFWGYSPNNYTNLGK